MKKLEEQTVRAAREDARALEVEGIDVLVFLRRILGVLDGAVGSRLEPFRVLAHPRVVGRRLEGDVQRNLDVPSARFVDQPVEAGEVAQLRVNCAVAAYRGTDRPRHARVGHGLRRGVVGALAVLPPDRRNGWQIERVETQALDVIEASHDILERAVTLWIRRR